MNNPILTCTVLAVALNSIAYGQYTGVTQKLLAKLCNGLKKPSGSR